MAADVAAAFQQAYGRDLSAAAALGYDAGRLLDAAIARADDGVEDLESVVAAASAVNDVLVSSDAAANDRAVTERAVATPLDAAADAGTGRFRFVAAVGTAMTVALLAVLLGLRVRSSRRSVG